MSQDEVAALARAFSAHLGHLRDFRGLRYVRATAMPSAEHPADAALEHTAQPTAGLPQVAPVSAPAPAPAAPEPSSASRQEPAAAQAQAVAAPAAEPSRAAPQHAASLKARAPEPRPAQPAARAQPPRAEAKQAARTQAGEWSAERKLAYLRERNVGDCQRCRLSETRRHIVFGVGNPEADLMFVGEAPGAEEDRRGEPFVGAAGQRLDHWIRWLGFGREQVYIANVIKCRPPQNRDPHPVEIERCSPFLRAQIRAIEPRVIVAIGRFAGCLLLGRDQPMYEMRGQVHRYVEPKTARAFPLVVTYHPSYVLRREREQQRPDRGGAIKSEDQKVLDDLSQAAQVLGLQRAR